MRWILVLAAVLATDSALAQTTSRQDLAPRAGNVRPQPTAGLLITEPTVIETPGTYTVARPISAPGTIIDIKSSHVRLDLNGLVLESTGSTSPVINVKHGPGVEDVVIANGSIRGGSACVLMDRTVRSNLRSIKAAACPAGVVFEDNEALIAEDNQIGSFEEPAPLIGDDCRNCTIKNNTVIGGLSSGLIFANPRGGEISENKVWSSLKCFGIGGEGVRVSDNIAHNCGNAMQIDARFALIEDNQLSNSGSGLTFGVQSLENVYRGNIVRNVFDEPFADKGTGNTSNGDNYLPDLR